MKVLLTGATGRIGAAVARRLLDAGHEVRLMRRPGSRISPELAERCEAVEGDLLFPQTLDLAAAGVEAVCHTAGLISYWRPLRARLFAVNVDGTRNMLRAALKNKVRRFVHTSSLAAIGFRRDGLADETTPWNWGPLNIPYAQSKHLAEAEVLAAARQGLEVVILNPAMVLGASIHWPADQLKSAPSIDCLAAAVPICDLDDVSAAHVAALDNGRNGRRYILGGASCSFEQLYRDTAQLLGLTARIRPLPRWEAAVRAWTAELISRWTGRKPFLTPEFLRLALNVGRYSSALAARELQYAQTPLGTTLRKMTNSRANRAAS